MNLEIKNDISNKLALKLALKVCHAGLGATFQYLMKELKITEISIINFRGTSVQPCSINGISVHK